MLGEFVAVACQWLEVHQQGASNPALSTIQQNNNVCQLLFNAALAECRDTLVIPRVETYFRKSEGAVGTSSAPASESLLVLDDNDVGAEALQHGFKIMTLLAPYFPDVRDLTFAIWKQFGELHGEVGFF